MMKPIVFALLLQAILAGCATTGPSDVLPAASPADPSIASGNGPYAPVLADYERREPTDPKSWRELNEDLTRGAGS